MAREDFRSEGFAVQEEPVLVTRLRKDEERHRKGIMHFSCDCSVCLKQAHGIRIQTVDPLVAKNLFVKQQGSKRSFSWVLELLGEVSTRTPIKLPLPDVCVLRKGKVAFLLQSARDRSLKLTVSAAMQAAVGAKVTASGEKLSLHNIQKMFTKIVKERKKEDPGSLKGSKVIKTGSVAPSTAMDGVLSKDVAAVRYLKRDKINDDNMTAKDEEGPLRFMTSTEFFQLIFDKRSGDPYWKTISYIQTVLKCKYGIGEIYEIWYFSHDSPEQKASHNLNSAGENQEDTAEEVLCFEQPERYCLLLLQRIAYFLEQHCHYELLRMKGEFMKDENGKIWLTWATKIAVRPTKFKQSQSEAKEGFSYAFNRQELMEELESAGEPRLESHEAQRLAKYMSDHYEVIKTNTGVNKLFEKEPPDMKTNEAFARLRPMTPYTFEELLDPHLSDKVSEKYLSVDTSQKSQPHSRRATTAGKRRPGVKRDQSSEVSLVNQSLAVNSSVRRSLGWVYNPRVRLSPTKSHVSRSFSSVKWSVG